MCTCVNNVCGFYSTFLLFLNFLQHRDTQETLAVLERLDLDTEKPTDEELARKFGFEEDYMRGTVSWWQQIKPQIWSLFDEPYSSNSAKVSKIVQIHEKGIVNGKLISTFFNT